MKSIDVRMMQKIGLTGGIGSGKSLVAKVFSKMYNIPVFNADNEAKRLMQINPNLKKKLIGLLGNNTYLPNGELNKVFVADKIFNNQALLEKVNQLVHEAVRTSFQDWASKQHAPYIIHEAAILVESGFHKMLHTLINVNAPEQIRIRRVMKRDNMSKEQVLQRMEKQLSDRERGRYADYNIINDEKNSIIAQVSAIHEKIIQNG